MMRREAGARKAQKAFLCLLPPVLFLLANLCLCFLHYREYRQKLELVYDAVEADAAGESALSWAASVLKNGVPERTGEPAPGPLPDYGYDSAYPDALRGDFVRSCLLTLAGSSALFLSAALSAYGIVRRMKRRQRKKLEELRTQLSLLREGRYEQAEAGPDMLGISSLAGQMRLVTEQAAREREGTKALVTDISHQLKTPLSALSASLDILTRGELTQEEQREFIGRCALQCARLNELAEALVSVSRMETGMIEVRPVRAPVFDTILLAVNRIYPRAEEKRIELVLEENKEAEQTILLQDVRWLSEAFINILENAVKYSEPCGTVTIRLERLQTFLRVEFADEGIGIPKKERNSVFKRFYRGESERVRQENGSGVGLYLTRKIIEQHNGTIRVKDGQGRHGSVFVVQLPYLYRGG